MGGINHQPCGAALPYSTFLSLCLSKAISEKEQANIALEEIILGELEGRAGSVNPILEHLQLSMTHIVSAIDAVEVLRTKMDEGNYKDLPPLRKLDLASIGRTLAGRGDLNQESWDRILTLFRSGTFYKVLDFFSQQLQSLQLSTDELILKVSALEGIAAEGSLRLILEENREGNFKQEFAVLYTSWNNFLQDFLASSLISTEVWYAFRGFGSLVSRDAISKVA